jgi:hypothetical protein
MRPVATPGERRLERLAVDRLRDAPVNERLDLEEHRLGRIAHVTQHIRQGGQEPALIGKLPNIFSVTAR